MRAVGRGSLLGLCILAVAVYASAQVPPNYQLGNFDVYKFSTDGTPVPDVDKVFHGHVGTNSCWQATAANMLAAAGYGIGAGAGATAQQRADHVYTQITNDLGVANMGCADRAINYWLYTYGKNPNSPEFMPANKYTDVTKSQLPIPLVPPPAAGGPNIGYNWLLDELTRCQYVAVLFEDPAHCMTLVGGNYWSNPNNRPDGNKSIWHDSDGAAPGWVGPGGGDNPDTVTHPPPVGAHVDDDVYTNMPVGPGNWWTLSDYWSGPTSHADAYVTLCEGLNKPETAMRNFDVAYYLQANDPDQILDDPGFRIAGNQAAGAAFLDDVTLMVDNFPQPQMHKEVYLLVDYLDRVAGRQEILQLLSDDGRIWNPVVTASADDGQLLFTWILDYQPAWEQILFPDNRYSTLTGDVKDWDLSTICVPEPVTLALLGLGAIALAARRRSR